MDKTPKFIRDFSKEKSPEERQQTAQTIRAKRAEHFTEKRAQTERRSELQETTGEREKSLDKKLEAIRKLESEITELSNSGFKELLNYFKLKKVRADAVVGQRTYEKLKQQQDKGITELQTVSEKLKSQETPSGIEGVRAMLDNFYKEQEEKWARSEYSKEDIIKYFSEENLASLSLEDYTLLLKRFPREMVTHVTRQGIRDHVGHMHHTAGKGAYFGGFMKMVEDGRLRSPLGVYLIENEKEQALVKFLELNMFKNKEEALESLAFITTEGGFGRQGEPGTYVDRAAIHFATEEVADTYYGSEKGNEIFITYPSAHVASQYYFSGQLGDEMSRGDYWNDQWVWANEERGMDLNAGIIFIPEEAKVDKKTGSRYKLDKNNNPIENSDYQDAIRHVVDSPDFYNFEKQLSKVFWELTRYGGDAQAMASLKLKKLEPFRQLLKQEFGISDQRLQSAILDNSQYFSQEKKSEEKGIKYPGHSVDLSIDKALEDKSILFLEAQDTINSKEFWEEHFAKNPTKKPSKIVYYKGVDPTRALLQWRKDQGIDKKAGDIDIGFPERRIDRDEPQAIAGLDRFKLLAEKVIEDYFEK
ncbi:hypothetical protein HOD96_00085 [Candidatus Falkowbacteria bacterium]|jgi:hypothetical protein|nr:hypothetical protein [Candidatus Falkowbacteria bacterium]MBT4432808.1 hypothetical protein [Candidatus Falkowbacteria bacterium]